METGLEDIWRDGIEYVHHTYIILLSFLSNFFTGLKSMHNFPYLGWMLFKIYGFLKKAGLYWKKVGGGGGLKWRFLLDSMQDSGRVCSDLLVALGFFRSYR